MLAFDEQISFARDAEAMPDGVYRARDIRGPKWESTPDKTDYGRRLRVSVEAGIFPRVARVGRSVENHQLYELKD